MAAQVLYVCLRTVFFRLTGSLTMPPVGDGDLRVTTKKSSPLAVVRLEVKCNLVRTCAAKGHFMPDALCSP